MSECKYREKLKDKKRIIIKIGSSSLTHQETGRLDLIKLETLIRQVSDLRNRGKDVIMVTSGAIMAGRTALGFQDRPKLIEEKQACAAVGQARLMMIYQKFFAEYNQVAAQILMTKYTVRNSISRKNACNTFSELLRLGVIPVVNENDTVATNEIEAEDVFGDNDTLSAEVARLVGADLLILLSDIDGLYTDDPHTNPEADFIRTVENLDDKMMAMGKGSTGSNAGTGGMATKLSAAEIAVEAGADMIIANGADFHIISRLIDGSDEGTLFVGKEK